MCSLNKGLISKPERVQLAQEDDGLDRRGTMWIPRIFMRSAGMRHSPVLRSISDHAA
jgi:hypothetical protein